MYILIHAYWWRSIMIVCSYHATWIDRNQMSYFLELGGSLREDNTKGLKPSRISFLVTLRWAFLFFKTHTWKMIIFRLCFLRKLSNTHWQVEKCELLTGQHRTQLVPFIENANGKYRGLYEKFFNGLLQWLDLWLELWSFINRNSNRNDRARHPTCTSKSLLGTHKYIWYILIFAK